MLIKADPTIKLVTRNKPRTGNLPAGNECLICAHGGFHRSPQVFAAVFLLIFCPAAPGYLNLMQVEIQVIVFVAFAWLDAALTTFMKRTGFAMKRFKISNQGAFLVSPVNASNLFLWTSHLDGHSLFINLEGIGCQTEFTLIWVTAFDGGWD